MSPSSWECEKKKKKKKNNKENNKPSCQLGLQAPSSVVSSPFGTGSSSRFGSIMWGRVQAQYNLTQMTIFDCCQRCSSSIHNLGKGRVYLGLRRIDGNGSSHAKYLQELQQVLCNIYKTIKRHHVVITYYSTCVYACLSHLYFHDVFFYRTGST